MKLENLINKIEIRFPKDLAYDWDNVGLMLGDKEQDIKKVLCCLDVNSKTIDYAINSNVDLIVSHHPLIFSPIKNITVDDITTRKIVKLMSNNISVYSAHTNCDSAMYGLNDYVMSILDFDAINIYENYTLDKPMRIIELKKAISIDEVVLNIKQKLNLKNVKLVYDEYYMSGIIKKIALVTGSGMDFANELVDKVDLLITADVKHHAAIDSLEQGLAIIDVGHYESEIHFVDLMYKFLIENTDLDILCFYDEPILKNR